MEQKDTDTQRILRQGTGEVAAHVALHHTHLQLFLVVNLGCKCADVPGEQSPRPGTPHPSPAKGRRLSLGPAQIHGFTITTR